MVWSKPAYAFYRGGFGMIPAMAVYWKRGFIGGALRLPRMTAQAKA